MGGSTKILSERNKLADYVKNGKDIAEITVTVYKDDRRNRKVFCREFDRKNKSIYHIDQRKVTEKEYIEQITGLNIQVGNLCQFLPQERVQDFAKQNPQELFASTQKSVCSEEMIESFDKLKELRNIQLNGNKQTERTADLLREHERRVELLQTAVDNIRRQDEILHRKNVIEKKLAWMDFEELYQKCREVSNDLEKTQKKYDENVKKKHDLEKFAEDKKKERQKYEKSLTNESSKKKKCTDELDRISGEIDKLESALHNGKTDLEAYIRSAQEQELKVDENRMVLNTYQQECDNYLEIIGSVDQIKQQMNDIDEIVNKTRDEIRLLTGKRSTYNSTIENAIKPSIVVVDNKLNALNSVAEAKLNFLQNNYPHAYAAVMWLRKNHQMFRGRIYEPMIMEINVRSNEYAKYIENCVKLQDLIAFTCEETEDMNNFLKIMRVDKQIEVNAVHSSAANGLRFKPKVPLNELRKLGGEIYLVDCIEAPYPILNFLCQSSNLHNVLIGNDNLERKSDLLPPSMALFFTPTHRVFIKASKYSETKSYMSSQIKSKNILNVRASQRELADLQEQKKKLIQSRDQEYNKRNEVESRITVLEEQCKTNFQEKGEHQKRIFEYEQLQKKVKLQEHKLKRLSDEPFDINAEQERFNQQSKEIVKKMLKFHENSIKVYEQMLIFELNEVKARARLVIFKNGTANFDADFMEINDQINSYKTYCDKINAVLDRTKRETKEKQVIALKMTENHRPSEGDKFPYKKDFDELSNDRNELSDEMDDLEQQINCRSSNDQAVLDEYKER